MRLCPKMATPRRSLSRGKSGILPSGTVHRPSSLVHRPLPAMAATPTSANSSSSSSSGDDDEPIGYKAIFGNDGKKKPIPKWLPVALLAFSTAAMAIPIVMLRRHRASTLGKALADTPPPPTRKFTSKGGMPIANPSATSLPPSQSYLPSSSSTSGAVRVEDNFNGALHCAKAFGIATLLVGVGATTTVWGVRTYMGVETTQEFADRMRVAVLNRLPALSARIHRPPAPDEGDLATLSESLSDPTTTSLSLSHTDAEDWNWPEAERRLKEAFEKDGFTGWAAAALRELEAEGRLERSKRGHV
ncbi:hypothetical protein BD413DRAFT_519828 [Trametes elegans]|nr:hypothetical protein BD413DRAFT_519828 [Trametes elegans]